MTNDQLLQKNLGVIEVREAKENYAVDEAFWRSSTPELHLFLKTRIFQFENIMHLC